MGARSSSDGRQCHRPPWAMRLLLLREEPCYSTVPMPSTCAFSRYAACAMLLKILYSRSSWHDDHENQPLPPPVCCLALYFADIFASSSCICFIVMSRFQSCTRFSLKYFICGTLVSQSTMSTPVLAGYNVPNFLRNPSRTARPLVGTPSLTSRPPCLHRVYHACPNTGRKYLLTRSTSLSYFYPARRSRHPGTWVALMLAVVLEKRSQ